MVTLLKSGKGKLNDLSLMPSKSKPDSEEIRTVVLENLRLVARLNNVDPSILYRTDADDLSLSDDLKMNEEDDAFLAQKLNKTFLKPRGGKVISDTEVQNCDTIADLIEKVGNKF